MGSVPLADHLLITHGPITARSPHASNCQIILIVYEMKRLGATPPSSPRWPTISPHRSSAPEQLTGIYDPAGASRVLFAFSRSTTKGSGQISHGQSPVVGLLAIGSDSGQVTGCRLLRRGPGQGSSEPGEGARGWPAAGLRRGRCGAS